MEISLHPNNDSDNLLTGKRVLVVGLGRFGGGVGVTRFLVEQGAKVRVSDILTKEDLQQSLDKLKDLPIELSLGENKPNDLDNIDLVVVNPALSPDNLFIKEIEKRNIPQTTEVNLFFERCKGKIIGIVGTNGKESVLRMVEAMLRAATIPHMVGGNMGASLLGSLSEITNETYVLFELSSFQLDRLRWTKRAPHILAYNNISENHLDWHGTLKNYIEAKLSALENQTARDIAIINVDNELLKLGLKKTKGQVIPVGMNISGDGITIQGDSIIARGEDKITELASTNLMVPGVHNLYNALVATGVGYAIGLNKEIIEPAIQKFHGVPHALQFVAKKNGISFFNDSAATNVEATKAAIDAFNARLWVIVGGYDKKIDYSPLVKLLDNPKVAGVATIGTIGSWLEDQLKQSNADIPFLYTKTLDLAFEWVTKQTVPGDIVLLSPATSSYDQFKNLEQRGEQFISLVERYGA